MVNPSFQIVSGSDKDYFDAIEAVKEEGEFIYDRFVLGELGEINAQKIAFDSVVLDILAQDVKIVPNFTIVYPKGLQVTITRNPPLSSNFDQVSVARLANNYQQQQYNTAQDALEMAKLAATLQKHLGRTSGLVGVGNLLGPSVKEHFEAREIALARLEKMSSKLLREMEDARKRRDDQFRDKEDRLEKEYQEKSTKLQATISEETQALALRSTDLNQKSKELDDRAAKHARRQHYKDIKEKFKSLGETFQVTAGTKGLRGSVFWFTVFLLLLFGGLAGLFLFQSMNSQSALTLYPAIAKQVTFTALFVTTAYFFIRWNNQWFQRHANEEFRLKRMELDIDRASWFVEMAFEWKDDKGEEIPDVLIDRLTQGLFGETGTDHAVEPSESLLHALLGAASVKVKLPGNIEAEYDRPAVKKLARKPKSSKEEEKKHP